MSIERQGGRLVLTRQPIAVDAMPLRIRGTVGSSLYRSARAAGAPPKAIQQYLQTLDQHISLEGDVTPEDKFDIIVAHKRAASGESETGNLIYAGLEQNGKPRAQLMRWGDDGQFFEASGMGQQRASSGMLSPVAGRMTSSYGMRRHPILGYARMHAGIDFGAAWGSPIYAVSDGMVSYAGRHGGHGNYVRLEHGGGLGTGYAHMSRIAVSSGTRVHAGQVIGYVGSTGLSTGPHLHYELYQNGRTVNPLSVSFTVNQQVDKEQLATFKERLAKLLSVRPGAALGPMTMNKPASIPSQIAQAGNR
jgi:murein DD-endopeptidase MepM/ murein hydrolase activator NlpD